LFIGEKRVASRRAVLNTIARDIKDRILGDSPVECGVSSMSPSCHVLIAENIEEANYRNAGHRGGTNLLSCCNPASSLNEAEHR
jgi:hypothetical protein